jgi:hypothetical protein
VKLDLAILDKKYDEWLREDESLSGFLNMKFIKQKNTEFRQKLEAWKKRGDERKRIKRKTF